MNAAQWPAEAREVVKAAIYADAEGVDPDEQAEVTGAVLEALQPSLETMLVQAQEDALANQEYVEVDCPGRHIEQQALDDLLRAAEGDHYVDHEGPWRTCTTALCRAFREALG